MITKIIKARLIAFSAIICPLASGVVLNSCSDMLETESTRQVVEPTIGDRTDSVFYAYGILQAMQQLADQYVFQGEMRGELVKTTRYTEENLQKLARFEESKYDSAYVYYRVINNCNYFLNYCDTTLYRGSDNVMRDKYAAAMAIRAWAYLQLGRNYKEVPYVDKPLTAISQIEEGNFPMMNLTQLVQALAPGLEKFSGQPTPSFGFRYDGSGVELISVGSPNWSSNAKMIIPHNLFVPVDVVLGDMYLETEQFGPAAQHYITYLTKVAKFRESFYCAPMASKSGSTNRNFSEVGDDDLPNKDLISKEVIGTSWSSIFSNNSFADIITYIPMAVSRENGPTTQVPLTFGFNYYATNDEKESVGRMNEPYVRAIQLLPSDQLNLLSDSTEYYYYTVAAGKGVFDSVSVAKCGDMRLRSIMTQTADGDSVLQWIDKYKYANIILYRRSTILLHLAEAFNRLDMPDAAFAILKDGLSDVMTKPTKDFLGNDVYYPKYLTETTRTKLQNDYPILSAANASLFPGSSACGIHSHGAGRAAGDIAGSLSNVCEYSPYNFERMVGLKLNADSALFKADGIDIKRATRADTINAVEELLCDEYALELAFEGTRYYDLMRLARHKNNDSNPYCPNFGYVWLKKKLGVKGWDESKMYLRFH